MVRFTKTGLEGLTNKAIHEVVEDRKKAPVKEDSPEAENTQTQAEEQKEITGSITYGTKSEAQRVLFNGSYHTFTTNSSNQLQCTCCPEPILMKTTDINDDFSVGKKDSGYLATSSRSQTYSLKAEKKSDFLYK